MSILSKVLSWGVVGSASCSRASVRGCAVLDRTGCGSVVSFAAARRKKPNRGETFN